MSDEFGHLGQAVWKISLTSSFVSFFALPSFLFKFPLSFPGHPPLVSSVAFHGVLR